MNDIFEQNRIIAATRSDSEFLAAVESDVSVIFDLNSDIMTLSKKIKKAHENQKKLFVHIDLAGGVGKDESGIIFLKKMGVDGIISTKASMIRAAKELGISTVQRFFALDSQGVNSISEMIESSKPDLIEIMPGIATKVIERFSGRGTPLIAGGLIETKSELTEALTSGAEAVSTGKEELWYM